MIGAPPRFGKPGSPGEWTRAGRNGSIAGEMVAVAGEVGRALLALSLLVAFGFAQEADPAALVTEAERALQADEKERATMLLWQAEDALDPLADDATTRILRPSIRSLTWRADPLHEKRAQARAEIAGELLELARAYVRKKWYRTADDLVRTVAAYDRETADKLIPYLEKQLARLEPDTEEEAPASPEPEVSPDLLTRFEPFVVAGDWKRERIPWRSPPLDGSTPYVLTDEHRHEDHRISVDVQIGDRVGKAALVFGVRSIQEYLFCELYYSDQRSMSFVSIYRFDGKEGRAAERIGDAMLRLTAVQRADFVTLEVAVRGAEVTVSVNGKERLVTKLGEPARGGVGLLVPGNSKNTGPVAFRNLRIDPLPEDRPLEPVAGPEQPFLEAVAAAEERIAAGDVEEAVRALRETRRELGALESETLRASMEAAIDALIVANDPCADVRTETRIAVAERIAALAEEYRAADRRLCAWWLMRRASGMHAETVRERLEALAAELAPELEKEIGLAPEPDEPVDDAELVATFAEGRQYWATGPWSFEPGAVCSPSVRDGSALLLAPAGEGPKRAARVQFKVIEGEGGAGLVFAAKSSNDFWALHLVHGAEQSQLVLAHWSVNEWISAQPVSLRFSKAAREGFTTLAVEVLDGKVRVTAGGAEPIEIPVDGRLDGRFGLLASSDPKRAVRVAFRNFKSLDGEDGKDD